MALGTECSQPPGPMPDGSLDGGSEAGAPDAAPDTTPDAPSLNCTNTVDLGMGGTETGHPMPLGAPAGQARAGRLLRDQLPTDRTGLAVWQPNDFVLANNRVAVLLEAARPSSLYDPWGGKIGGMARVQDGRLVQAADFNEYLFGLGRFTLRTERVLVMNDGSDGRAAVVRAVGTLQPLPFIADLARALAPGDFTNWPAAFEYTLAPDSEQLQARVLVANPRTRGNNASLLLHGFFQRYRMTPWLTGEGFHRAEFTSALSALGFVDDAAMSYFFTPGSPMSALISTSGFDGFSSEGGDLPACQTTTFTIGSFVVGGPGLDGLQEARARLASSTLRAITGTLRDAAGMPVAGAHVHALSADGMQHLTRATTDAMGRYTLHVDAAAAVRVTAYQQGYPLLAPSMVPSSQGTQDLAFGPVGQLRLRITEALTGGATRPLPARVQLLPVSPTTLPEPPTNWGERTPGEGRLYIDFPHTGDYTMTAPAGRWRVLVSHGPEYDLSDTTVDLTAGATLTVDRSLRHVVDSTNLQCGDFHIHTWRSPDAADTGTLKLQAIVADGLDIAVRSEHEFVADFSQELAALGLQSWTTSVGSLELTTFAWGHFGVVPMTPDPSRVNAGAFDWPFRLPPAVFDDVRRSAGSPTLIINHPRGPNISSYFSASSYDPATGNAANTAMWDSNFTAVEVFNSSDFESNRNGIVADWFSFLSRGRRVFAVGSSDSHTMNPGSPVGYPRTCLYVNSDSPSMLTPVMVRDGVGQGRSTINGGILVQAQVGAATPGQDAMGVGPMANVQVTLQAPDWVSVTALEVIVDGRTVSTRALTAADRDASNPVVRFRGTVPVPVASAGSWVVVTARGDGTLDPVFIRQKPFGVSNPIFLRQ